MPPDSREKEITPILDELSHDPNIKLDQIKSLIIVCESFMMFPEYFICSTITTLTPDKRQRLVQFVSFALHNQIYTCWIWVFHSLQVASTTLILVLIMDQTTVTLAYCFFKLMLLPIGWLIVYLHANLYA